MRLTKNLILLLVMLLGISSIPASAQIVVIISSKSVITKINPEHVSQIFLGQAKTFHTGGMAIPIDLTDSKEKNEFYLKLTGKSPAQVKAYWSKLVFSGSAQPPQALPDSKSVVKLVAENPKYIGYVDKAAVDASVRVVFSP